ncbi:unnamed protein product [Cylindrotheca closterium]|uniref:Uncharacterized protein n=1 Tax=Cylindrotheca closterium TaxID=2856 RepID=A0AAD2G787_9STRA|nr:unnamed protein product [Cylindrotheca closterium]
MTFYKQQQQQLAIIELNNLTVDALRQQHFYNAITSSSSALKCYKAIQQSTTNELLSCSFFAAPEDYCIDQSMLLSEPNPNATGHSTNSSTFIYDLGIPVPPGADATIVATILIFNLALAYQLCGNQQQYDTKMLLKAKQLYELAHKGLDVDQNVHFHFAIINNIAVIEHQIGNTAASKDNFEYLMSLFMLLVDRGTNSVGLRHMNGFLVNLPSTSVNAAHAA